MRVTIKAKQYDSQDTVAYSVRLRDVVAVKTVRQPTSSVADEFFVYIKHIGEVEVSQKIAEEVVFLMDTEINNDNV